VPDTFIIVGGLQSVDWLTLGSGIVGVVLGAALSYFVTYQFERRRLQNERLARSYSLVFAVQKITDDLTKMERDIRAGIATAKAAGVEGEVWTKLRFGVGYSEPITIPAEDLTVVALTRDNDLTTQIGEVENSHRIFLDSIRTLQALMEKFESFELQTSVQGEIVSFEADAAQQALIAPTLIRLRTLSQSVCSNLPAAAAQARDVAARLGPHLKDHYKFKHFVVMTFSTEELSEPQPKQRSFGMFVPYALHRQVRITWTS
jgi:hypothetical protein